MTGTKKEWTCHKCDFKGTEKEVVVHSENCIGKLTYICHHCHKEQNEVREIGTENTFISRVFSLEEPDSRDEAEINTDDSYGAEWSEYTCPNCGCPLNDKNAEIVSEIIDNW